ncbi:MAG: hypothetical protein N2Z65_06530 [Clostridiales bacterium]|nr:hypothetical protein [Clostridiales bacterium]
MKRNKMTILILSITVVLILGIFLSFYLSYLGISDGDTKITLPSDKTIVPATSPEEMPIEKVEITTANVQRVIASMSRPNSYSFDSDVTLYYSGGNTSWKNHHSAKNGYTKTEQYNENGILMKHVITGNGKIFIWRPGGDARYYSGHLGDETSDSVQRIPAFEDIVNRDPSEIQEAKYVNIDGNNCIYVRAQDKTLQYTDEYWISLDYGLLIQNVTKSKEKMIYKMKVSNISITPVDDKTFLLPNNTLAMDVTVS